MRYLKLLFFAAICVNISCKSNQAYLSQNALHTLPNHHRIAVLPFKVTFTDEYRRMSRLGLNLDWDEQQRLAGLDMQKTGFTDITKRALKKNWQLTVQDFLQTDKILAQNNIGFAELQQADKSAIARILNVDAVVWGVTNTEYSMRNYGRNGIKTQMMLFDATTNELVWQNESMQYLTSRMDSPQSLANNTVSSLINSLPYMGSK